MSYNLLDSQDPLGQLTKAESPELIQRNTKYYFSYQNYLL